MSETTNTAPVTPQAEEVKPAEAQVETPKAEAKPEAEAKVQAEVKPEAPKEIAVKLPEGSLLDAKRIDEIVAEAKAKGISSEEAQANLEREDKAVAAYAEAQKAQLTKQTEAWKAEFMNHPEYGGVHANENAEHAKRFIQKFASPALKEALDTTGLGNFPDLVYMCAQAGKLLANDSFVHASAKTTAEKSLSEIFYPKEG